MLKVKNTASQERQSTQDCATSAERLHTIGLAAAVFRVSGVIHEGACRISLLSAPSIASVVATASGTRPDRSRTPRIVSARPGASEM
eukprot:7536185-Pyramimonas_sp.AAC.1